MVYLIEITIYTGLMLLVYQLLLKDKPMHRFNRAYLLATISLPLLIPFLKLPEMLAPKTNITLNSVLPEVLITTVQEDGTSSAVWWYTTLVVMYIVGAIIAFGLMMYSFFKMRNVISKADKGIFDGYTILKNTGYGPGSWNKYIFLPKDEVQEPIITHELAHIQLQHSKDLLFLNLMRSLLWPNLFLHFIKNELVLVHEFQADAKAGVEKETYAQLLLSSVFSTCTLPLSHSFIVHPIKRRIMMLNSNKPKSKLRSVLAVAMSLAIMLSIVTVQSCQTKAENQPLDGAELQQLTKMPEPGYNIGEFLGKEVKYPKEAMKEGVEGRIAVKFMIDEKGVIKEAKVVNKEYDKRLGDAALSAVMNMPNWQPGMKDRKAVATWYTIPIKFELPKEEELKNKLINELKEKIENGEIDAKDNMSKKEVEQRKREISRELDRMEQGFDKNNPPPPPPPPTNEREVDEKGFKARMDRNNNKLKDVEDDYEHGKLSRMVKENEKSQYDPNRTTK